MNFIQALIYIHAFFGGLSLISGFGAAATQKGKKNHRRFGSVFYYSLLISILLSLIIAILPGHTNAFLFSIGIFSLYALYGGKRTLQTNKPAYNLSVDKILAYLVIINGGLMIFLPYFILGSFHPILSFFGLSCIVGGIQDLFVYRDFEKYKNQRILIHIRKMSGAYIASVTAFVVVNNIFPGLWGWFLPSIIGSIFVAYFSRKWKKQI